MATNIQRRGGKEGYRRVNSPIKHSFTENVDAVTQSILNTHYEMEFQIMTLAKLFINFSPYI